MAFHNIPPNGFPDLPDMEELEAVVKDVNNLSDNKANQITIAPFFNPEASYEVGDLVYYNGLSYRCTNDHEGEWDADDFATTTVSNELATLKNGLTGLISVETHTTNSDTASANGGRLGLTCSTTKVGYTAIGIVGITVFNDQNTVENGVCLGLAFIDDSGNVQISARNYTSNAITAYADVDILYTKNV